MAGGLKQAIDWAAGLAKARARAHGRGQLGDGGGGGAASAEPPAEAPREAVLPSMIWIRYEGENGQVSERTVTLREAWRDDGRLHLTAWRHLEGDAWAFEVTRIRELVCLATGESTEDPVAWIREHVLLADGESDDTGRALALTRDELALLAYLGRADGCFDPDEIEVAVDHVALAGGRPVDRARCAAVIARLAPDPDDLPAVLQRVAEDARRWERFRNSAVRLVRADGEVSPGEEGAWKQIEHHYESASAARKAEFAGLLGRSGLAGVFVMDLAEHGVLAYDPGSHFAR